jgi:hypothetical protein
LLKTIFARQDILAYFKALGWNWKTTNCQIGESAGNVSCGYLTESDVSRALGVEPMAGKFNFKIQDGKKV